MSATACMLSALLLFEGASPPSATEECALTDNRCKAGLYERQASSAQIPAQRARYLYTAYRSYLFLFDKSGDRHDLCAARRALDASLAVVDQPQAQRTMSESMRVELVAQERREAVRCGQRPTKNAQPPLARGLAAEPPGDFLTDPPQRPQPAKPDARPPSTTEWSLLADPQEAPQASDLMPVPVRLETTQRPADAPRPGRGLVIAGGATLGVGIALTAAAGAMGRRLLDTRQAIRALGDRVDGYATTQQMARDEALRRDFRAAGTRTLALAITGGTTVLVAVVLASIGGRRMARAASRTALIPAPGGLAVFTRF